MGTLIFAEVTVIGEGDVDIVFEEGGEAHTGASHILRLGFGEDGER